MIEVTLPLRILSEANQRGHWSKGAKRAREQRGIVRLAIGASNGTRDIARALRPVDMSGTKHGMPALDGIPSDDRLRADAGGRATNEGASGCMVPPACIVAREARSASLRHSGMCESGASVRWLPSGQYAGHVLEGSSTLPERARERARAEDSLPERAPIRGRESCSIGRQSNGPKGMPRMPKRLEPCVVASLTRIGPKRFDTDNLARALKAVRDGVADALGVDDGDSRVEWRYEQRSALASPGCVNGYGVHIRIEAKERTTNEG